MKDVRQSLASFRVDVPIGAKLRLIIYRRPQGRGIGPELVQRRAVMVLEGADSGLLPSWFQPGDFGSSGGGRHGPAEDPLAIGVDMDGLAGQW